MTDLGEEPAERVMEIHSRLSGVERVILAQAREVARQTNQPTPGELAIDGTDPVAYRAGYSDRFMAAWNESLAGDEERRAQPFSYSEDLPENRFFRSNEVRAAVFESDHWDPFTPRQPGYTPIITRPIQVIDVIPMGRTMTDAIAWMEETGFTNAAAGVAEGANAPESDLVATERTQAVVRIAHTLPVSEQILEDEGIVRSYIDMRMPFGVRQKTDSEIINGAGGNSLDGILNRANVQNIDLAKISAADTSVVKPLNQLLKGCTKVKIDGRAIPTHFVLNPYFWEECALSESASGGFYLGNPREGFQARVWGPANRRVGYSRIRRR